MRKFKERRRNKNFKCERRWCWSREMVSPLTGQRDKKYMKDKLKKVRFF